jgi:uncharacterized OB-fold protein
VRSGGIGEKIGKDEIMADQNKKTEELLGLDNKAEFSYNMQAGGHYSRFFNGMKDKKLWSTYCPDCDFHYLPPRPVCGQCDKELTQWALHGHEGGMHDFDIKFYNFFHPRAGKEIPTPWADCSIKLDTGAYIQQGLIPPDAEAHQLGDRYRIVWNPERKGHVDDILHFEKVEGEGQSEAVKPELTDAPELTEYVTTPIIMHSPYKKWFGKTLTRFFQTIRDEKKITATVCKKCNKTFCMPETICPDCFARLDDFVELSGEGSVVNYTVVRYTEQYQPHPGPCVYAIIRMDGADNTLNHCIGGIDPDEVAIGMKVKPEFKVDRNGDIRDIKFFSPV